MKPIVTLKVEIGLGSSVFKVFEEAIRVATQLNVYIEFNFNGVTCLARPNDDAKKSVKSYIIAVNNKQII